MTRPTPTESQEAANRVRWSPAMKAFYEVTYVQWWDEPNRVGGWVRYMLFASNQQQRAEAAVWAGFIALDDPSRTFTVKEVHPLASAQVSQRPFKLQIGSSSIASGAARGSIGQGPTAVAWDLAFDEPGMEIAHLPAPLRNLPFPPTKFVSGFCGGRASGYLAVAGKRYDFSGASAVQSHFWGPKNVVGWSWGHCSTFREDPGFVFDGVVAVDKLAGMTMKPLCIFFFRMDGVTYECNGMLDAMARNTAERSIEGWKFTASSGDLVFRGEAVARPAEMNLWLHEDPDGDLRQAHLTMTADYRIEVLRKTAGGLQPVRTVTSPRSGIYEITLPAVDPRVAHRHPTHLLTAPS